jgi:O-antigen/teichoic acid export membrane protein
MAVSVYLLNDYLIDLYGINGAAISTFIVLLVFTALKILYIVFKIKIQPYNLNSLKILFSIFTVYLVSYLINIDMNPLLEIIIRSIGIVIIYFIMISFFGISQKIKNLLKLKF